MLELEVVWIKRYSTLWVLGNEILGYEFKVVWVTRGLPVVCLKY